MNTTETSEEPIHTKIGTYARFIHTSRYAKFRDDLGRREIWEETVDRYFNFITEHLKENHSYDIPSDLKTELQIAVLNQEIMPSMRLLTSAGAAAKRENLSAFNCSFISVDNPRVFDEILYILMCFSPDTLVKTDIGDKEISKLTLNDKVLSYDFENKNYQFITPSNIVETPSSNKEKIEILFEDGSIIKCTSDHKFYTKNRGWVEAKNLLETDDIQNYQEI